VIAPVLGAAGLWLWWRHPGLRAWFWLGLPLALLAPSPAELAATIVLEAAVITLLARPLGWRRVDAVSLSLAVNLLTQPLLYLAMLLLLPYLDWWPLFLALEAGVWLIEARIYGVALRGCAAKALLLSLAANGTSAAVGLLLPF
jgi:hypothetical protein